MMAFGSRGGFGTGFLVYGALVFMGSASSGVSGDPDFAGATIHPAHLRTETRARLRNPGYAQTTGSPVPARLRKPEPAQTGRDA